MRRKLNQHQYIYKAVCKDSPGYLVKVPYKREVIQKWFLFKTHGGSTKALASAINWRDEMSLQTGRTFLGKAKSVGRGMYGVAGIVRSTDKWKKKLKNGKIRKYSREIIKITGARINGKIQLKKLSLKKYDSIEDAFQDALKIRNQFINEMNQK